MNLNQIKWLTDNPLNRIKIPQELRPWLCDQGSLTSTLKSLADGTFEVELLSQKIARPAISEQRSLRQACDQSAMIRQVNLCIHGEPVVYARSIIPLSLSKHGGGGLAALGRTPLGHLLFKNGRIRVSRREFTVVQADSKIMAARRSPYEYLGETILVSEFFLPSLRKYW